MFQCLNRLSALCAALIIGTMTYSASADTLIDTGPGQTSGGGGPSLFNDPADIEAGQFQFVAGQFTLDNDFTIETAEIWMRVSSFVGSGDMTVKLFSDTDDLPGTLLETATVTANFPAATLPNFPVGWVELDGLDWEYEAGTYWIAFEAIAGSEAQGAVLMGSGESLDAYAISNGLDLVDGYRSQVGTDWDLRLSGSQVPEPSCLALIGLGGILVLRRRREGGAA